MDKTKSRNDILDIVKGVAAILVVWGHAIQYFSVSGFEFWDSKVFQAIYSFHMPLFMLISGYLFYWTCTRKKWTSIAIGRIRGIGIPMIVWGTIIAVLTLRTSITLRGWFHQIIGIWFLYAVLISSLIVATITKLSGGGGRAKLCNMP